MDHLAIGEEAEVVVEVDGVDAVEAAIEETTVVNRDKIVEEAEEPVEGIVSHGIMDKDTVVKAKINKKSIIIKIKMKWVMVI